MADLTEAVARCRHQQPGRPRAAKGDVPGHVFHGNQWTDGIGGGEQQPASDDRPFKEMLRDYRAHVLKGEVKALGFPEDKVTITPGTRTFNLNGKTYEAAGFAYPDENRIEFLPDNVPEDRAKEVAAHEVAHIEFGRALRAMEAELPAIRSLTDNPPADMYASYGRALRVADERGFRDDERYDWAEEHSLQRADGSWTKGGMSELERVAPLHHAMEKAFPGQSGMPGAALYEEDGVTDYSRDWWEAWKKGQARTDSALHETYAEITAQMATTGKTLDEIAKPGWRKYVRIMRAAAKGEAP